MGKFHFKSFVACICIVMLLTGCFENNSIKPEFKFEMPKVINDGWEKAQELLDSTLSGITYDVDIEPVINAMNATIHSFPDDAIEIKNENRSLIENIAELPVVNNETLLTIEGYKQFADNINTLLKFLNREGGCNFKLLEKSTEEYDAISKNINRYTPLIDNYNGVVISARAYNENDEKSIKRFYIALGVFGFELALIFGHVWYKTTYKIVGAFYRTSGLNRLAFKCPTLIASILSTAHWRLRNKLVDETSNLMKIVLLSLPMNVLMDISSRIL